MSFLSWFDATLIPVNILQAVGARKIDSRWARNISGVRYRVTMYAVDLGIGSLTFPDTEVVANNQTGVCCREIVFNLAE